MIKWAIPWDCLLLYTVKPKSKTSEPVVIALLLTLKYTLADFYVMVYPIHKALVYGPVLATENSERGM